MAVRFKRSYRDRKEAVAKRKKTIVRVLIIVFSFQILFSVFLSTIRINSISMEPSLEKGSVMLYSPFTYGFKLGNSGTRLPQVSAPDRGDLIVFSPPYLEEESGFISVLFSAVKFLTFGKIDLKGIGNQELDNKTLVKRVIALPGDTIRISGNKASIKSSDSIYFLNEFEVIESVYDINAGILPDGWNESLPFAGNLEPLTLGEDEYFVLGDNRMMSSDSINWGVLKRDRIEGKILMTYWPFSGFKFYK